jgi:hypothetical protein
MFAVRAALLPVSMVRFLRGNGLISVAVPRWMETCLTRRLSMLCSGFSVRVTQNNATDEALMAPRCGGPGLAVQRNAALFAALTRLRLRSAPGSVRVSLPLWSGNTHPPLERAEPTL